MPTRPSAIPRSARAGYDLVRVQQRLLASNGVNTDLELALFDADHGRPAAALRAARAEWQRRSSVHVADALGWALLANGRPEEAWTYARQALSLGTRNASFLFHAGMIRLALGDRDGARSFLTDALATNPHFSIQHADEAAATLERLGGDAHGRQRDAPAPEARDGDRARVRGDGGRLGRCGVCPSARELHDQRVQRAARVARSGAGRLRRRPRRDRRRFQAIQDMDADGDGRPSASELQTWADERATEWVRRLHARGRRPSTRTRG